MRFGQFIREKADKFFIMRFSFDSHYDCFVRAEECSWAQEPSLKREEAVNVQLIKIKTETAKKFYNQ